MVIEDTVVARVASLPWNAPDGVPERVLPGALSSVMTDVEPPHRRAGVALRALPDGAAQILAAGPEAGRATAIRLAPDVRRVEFAPVGEPVDAVLAPDGGATVLERAGDAVLVRGLRPDGAEDWRAAGAEAGGLLVDGSWRLFLASDRALAVVDGGSTRVVASWRPGGEPFMDPAGRVAFVRYDPGREARDWVLLDPESGSETVVEGSDDAWPILERAIGVDAEGRAYGAGAGTLGRVALDGRVDWRLRLAGIAVDEEHGVTLLRVADHGALEAVGDGDAVPLEVPEDLRRGARLVRRTPDGGYVLYRRTGARDPGRLLLLDASGHFETEQPAGTDVWLKGDDLQPPSRSSVTPDGAVLVAVLGPEALHVLGLTPAR